MEEFLAIFEDMRARIPISEAEVENALALGLRRPRCRSKIACAAGACAESMHQPIERAQRRRFQNLQAARATQIPALKPRSPFARRRFLFRESSGHSARYRHYRYNRASQQIPLTGEGAM